VFDAILDHIRSLDRGRGSAKEDDRRACRPTTRAPRARWSTCAHWLPGSTWTTPTRTTRPRKPASSPTPRTNSPMTSASWAVGGGHIATWSRRTRPSGCRRPRPGSWLCGSPFTTPAMPPARPWLTPTPTTWSPSATCRSRPAGGARTTTPRTAAPARTDPQLEKERR
jgi:hypothetical protein